MTLQRRTIQFFVPTPPSSRARQKREKRAGRLAVEAGRKSGRSNWRSCQAGEERAVVLSCKSLRLRSGARQMVQRPPPNCAFNPPINPFTLQPRVNSVLGLKPGPRNQVERSHLLPNGVSTARGGFTRINLGPLANEQVCSLLWGSTLSVPAPLSGAVRAHAEAQLCLRRFEGAHN